MRRYRTRRSASCTCWTGWHGARCSSLSWRASTRRPSASAWRRAHGLHLSTLAVCWCPCLVCYVHLLRTALGRICRLLRGAAQHALEAFSGAPVSEAHARVCGALHVKTPPLLQAVRALQWLRMCCFRLRQAEADGGRRAGVRGADPRHEGADRPQRGGGRGVHLHRHAAPRCAASPA